MRIKLTKKEEIGYQWSTLITGYDIFETEEVLVQYLNEVGCKTYFNKKGEVVACCKADKIKGFMTKAEEMLYKKNKELC